MRKLQNLNIISFIVNDAKLIIRIKLCKVGNDNNCKTPVQDLALNKSVK